MEENALSILSRIIDNFREDQINSALVRQLELLSYGLAIWLKEKKFTPDQESDINLVLKSYESTLQIPRHKSEFLKEIMRYLSRVIGEDNLEIMMNEAGEKMGRGRICEFDPTRRRAK